MKKTLLVALVFVAFSSHAISHKHRAELAKSGCTQVQEANGTCFHGQEVPKKFPENLIGDDIGHTADTLIAEGWRANNGDWHKGKKTLRLVVENGKVLNAQFM